jgi:hypothetical protein
LLAAALAVAAATLAFATSPAGAIVTTVESTQAGLQPRSTTLLDGSSIEAATFANLTGNPIVSASKVYAIYWDPTDHYHGDWQRLIDTFLQSMGADSGALNTVFSVDSQYTDVANQHARYQSTLMGAFTDTEPYPSSGNCTDPHPLTAEDRITCLTNLQLRGELEAFIILHGLPKGMHTIYYILTPPGVTVCLDAGGPSGHCSDYEGLQGGASYEKSFCSYHSDINPGNLPTGDANTILYATIPWTAGGFGDGHLSEVDQTSAYDCQDGGYDPSSKPVVEELEKAKEKSKKQEEEFKEKSTEEKTKQLEAEKLAGPHEEEPNQSSTCPTPDGFCDTGLADLIINQIAVEQQNVVTNPLLNAWQDTAGNEATDECRNFFAGTLGGNVTAKETTGGGTLSNQSLAGNIFYLNDAFNLAGLELPYPAVPCLTGVSLQPHFTAPNPVNSGELAGFDGMESNISLNWGTTYVAGVPKPTYAFYTWNFGDGTPTVSGFAPGASPSSPGQVHCSAPWESPCAASEFHSFQYGGTYNVTLTVTDTGGNTASFTDAITVDGPARPTPPSPGSGSAGAGASAGAPATPGAGAKPLVPGPVATQSILSSSLSKTLSKGLVVRYSVSQQATGHFEVLLAASIAHRLGLHPPLAGGLPAGTPPQVVIAKALLVTTKAGRNTLKIQFGKVTAKRLRRLHKVPLMLRLTLRNPGGGTTTVLSKLTLH